jgi:hypothetical protein
MPSRTLLLRAFAAGQDQSTTARWTPLLSLLSPASCPKHAPRAPSPQDDRRPGWAPPATQARGGGRDSSVPGPTLCGGCSTGQGCTGRAGWRSRPQRRFGRCRSFGPAARSSGRGVLLPSAPSCLEHPLGRASETCLPCHAKGAGDRPVVGAAATRDAGGDRASRSTGLSRMVGRLCAATMRPMNRPWSAFGTWLTRPLSTLVRCSRKPAKQRVGHAGTSARDQRS